MKNYNLSESDCIISLFISFFPQQGLGADKTGGHALALSVF